MQIFAVHPYPFYGTINTLTLVNIQYIAGLKPPNNGDFHDLSISMNQFECSKAEVKISAIENVSRPNNAST
jgi:hypothetical protein